MKAMVFPSSRGLILLQIYPEYRLRRLPTIGNLLVNHG
jgi:hypothetical protein